jgi:hypothetical protein
MRLSRTLAVVGLISLFPAMAMAQQCNPACGTGQSCCVMQYSNGTHSSPYCKSGSCYTMEKQLRGSKESLVSQVKNYKAPATSGK